MSKRFLIIIAVLIIIVLAGGLVWYYFVLQSNGPSVTSTSGGFKNLYPFGNGGNGGNQKSTTTTQSPGPTNTSNYTAKLREISSEAVAGAGVLDTKTGSVVRYIERATGHIFEVELFSPNITRISNTTVPQIYDALWQSPPNALVARFLKPDNQNVTTSAIILKNGSTTTTISYPSHISDVSVFGNNMFYLISSEINSTGYVSSFDGKTKKQVWNSPVRELNSQFVNANTIALTTKPAAYILGYTYLVNTGGGVKKLLGNISGLSASVAPDANQALYLSQTNSAQMFYTNLSQGIVRTLTPVAFPEKCVWSKKDKNTVFCAVSRENLDGNSLSSWYQGLASFTDDIWKYDLKANTATEIENLSSDSGAQIDVIKPILSDSEKYLIFENKIDNSLWSLDLTK